MGTKYSAQTKVKRQSNIELLRIFAMIMIVAHHIGVHSKFNVSGSNITTNIMWVRFITMGGKLGVDIFMLITGYFLCTAKSFKISKALKVYLQVFLYSVIVYVLQVSVLDEKFAQESFVKALMPIIFSEWWYATSWFAVFLLSPFINRFINALDKKTYQRFLLLGGIFWCLVPTYTGVNFQYNSFIWFVYMYCLAGYIRLHIDISKISSKICIINALIVTILTFCVTIAFRILGANKPFFKSHVSFFYDQNKLTILLIAVFLFLGFLAMKIKYSPLINRIAATTFGVYLIHDSDFCRKVLWTDVFKNKSHMNDSNFIIYIIAEIVIVFALSTLIELFRQEAIERLYIKFVYFMEGALPKLGSKLYSICAKTIKRNIYKHEAISPEKEPSKEKVAQGRSK